MILRELGGPPIQPLTSRRAGRNRALACGLAVFAVALFLFGIYQVAGAGAAGRWPVGTPASQQLWEKVLAENRVADVNTPEEREALFWTGVATANLGRIEESRRAFLDLDAADVERVTGARVAEWASLVLARDPGNLQALNGLAFVAYARDEYPEAARVFQEILRLDPHNPWVRAYLGFSLGKANRIDEAVKVLEEGVRRFPDNEVLHFLLGLAYYQKGLILRALVEMAKAPGAVRYFR